MKNNNVIAAIVGGTFFAVPYIALSIPILPSLAIGSAAFIAGELVFKKNNKDIFNVSSGDFKKTIINAKKQNMHIKDMIANLEDKNIKDNLNEIYDSVSKIVNTIEINPGKVKNINNFFDYYLPLTIKIIDRYDEIEDNRLSSKDSKKFIESTNEMVKEINYAFKNILNKIYESDIIDTDAEMKVLNSMLKMDGFDSKEINVKEESNG